MISRLAITRSNGLVWASGVASTLLAVSTLGLVLTNSARAATGTWTGGGAGTWDTTDTNWSGVAGTPWDSANGPSNTALFGSVGDAATLSGGVYPANVTFNESATVTGSSVNRILYATNGASKTFTVASGKTGTITGDIDDIVGGDTSNILLVAGGGKLVLSGTTTLKSNTDNASNAYFQVDGGSELEIQALLITFAAAATNNRGSSTAAYLGNSSDNNIVRVTGTGRMRTGNFNIGTAGNDGNSVYISSAGSPATPSWEIKGNSAQLNLNSDGNLVQIDNGAYVTQNSGGGTGKWSIGTPSGGSNQIIVDNASVNKSSSGGIEIGLGSDSNSLTIQNGGTWVGGRVEVASSSGPSALTGSNNFQLVTGTNSYFRQNGGTNTFFDVGLNSGSNTNSFRVGAGGRADVFGSGTTRRTGVGQVAGANSNYVEISGAGAQFNFLHNLPLVIGGSVTGTTVTSGGNLNHIDVKNGGTLYMDNTTGTLAAPPANANFTYGANPALAAALVLTGTNSSFNLGDGTAIATAVIGKTAVIGDGVLLNSSTAVLNVDKGRLIAGTSAPASLVSGTVGSVINLLGDAYFSNSNGTTASISTPISGGGVFHKEGTGTIALTSASNSYTGNTYVDAGVLRLDNAFLDDASSLYLFSSGSAKMNLNFAGTDTIAALYFDNVLQPSGTYGKVGSGATFQNDTFFNNFPLNTFGSGLLNVAAAAETVPEPSTLALAALGLVGLGLAAWRQKRKVCPK